jgi:PKD domain
VNVQAMASSFGSGSVLSDTIAWNFGDSGSSYNSLVGFNAAHAYDNPGNYTITLSITTPDGHTGVATQKVTVEQDNRPTIYVAADGSDNNSGTSADAPIHSIAKLDQIIGSNTRVLFHDGDTFDFSSGDLNVGGLDNVYIGSYGSGSQPVIMYDGPADGGMFIGMSGSTQGLVIQGLTFNSIYSNAHDSLDLPAVFYMTGNDLTVRGCTFLNVLDDFGASPINPTNVLVQDNSSPDATALSAYFYFVGGNEIAIVGNTVADSVGEAVLRIGGNAQDILIAKNNFTEVPANGGTTGGKNVLSIQEGEYAYIYGNTLNTGPVEVGPIGTPQADPNGIFEYAVFDSNTLTNGANFVFNPNAVHVMDKNNVVEGNGNSSAFVINSQEVGGGFNWQVQDVYIEHNTVTEPGMWGGLLSISSGDAKDVYVDNNLFVDPNYETGYGEAFIKVNTNDMNSFAEIKDNVWSVPSSVSNWAQGGYFWLGSDPSLQANWLTPAEWEGTGIPTGDVYQNITLGSTFSVTTNGFTAGSTLPT